MASRHSRSSTPPDAVPSRYRNIRYKSDLYVQDVPTESYTRDAADFKVVNDEHEAIVIDNGTSFPLFHEQFLIVKMLQEHPISAPDSHPIRNPTSTSPTRLPSSRPENP